MAKIKLLIDTDIFIDYLNKGFLSSIFEDKGFEIYFKGLASPPPPAKPDGASPSTLALLAELIPTGLPVGINYSIVTKKELLSNAGLKEAERQAILYTLKEYRIIPLDDRIAERYSDLRQRYPSLEKGDTLIAATALVWGLPLVTRNLRHYKIIDGLTLFKGTLRL